MPARHHVGELARLLQAIPRFMQITAMPTRYRRQAVAAKQNANERHQQRAVPRIRG